MGVLEWIQKPNNLDKKVTTHFLVSCPPARSLKGIKFIQEIFLIRALRALSCHEWWPVGKLHPLDRAPGCSVHERRDLSELKEFSMVPLQGFHHICLFYSYQSCFISESLQLCLWGKWNSTRCKSEVPCFVLFGIGDLLRRKALLRGLSRINVWLPEGTKCSLQSLSPSRFSVRTNFPPWLDCLLWGWLKFPPAGVLLPGGSSTFCSSRTGDSAGTASRYPSTRTPHNLSDR